MNTSTQIELAAPALNQVAQVEATPKAELVISEKIDVSQSEINVVTVLGGGVGAALVFLFSGSSFDLLPVISASGVFAAGFANTLWRYIEIEENGSRGLKGVKFRHSAISFASKGKRIRLKTFGVNDPEGYCMSHWANSSHACSEGKETHVVTHYLVKKGFHFYREQEVTQSLEALWDSSLDAVQKYYV